MNNENVNNPVISVDDINRITALFLLFIQIDRKLKKGNNDAKRARS